MDLDLNVLCVQLLPVHLNPKESMEKVDRMIDKYREADIVVLPEMAFSGYTFNDFEEIRPILEEPKPGYLTFDWCSGQARRLNSFIFCGYPEISDGLGYNSMMVVSPTGTLVANYRKKFLYTLDKSWAREGDAFKSIQIEIRGKSIEVGLGICMDINPYEFEAPFNAFELANFWLRSNVDICVFCTNWTSSDNDEGINLLNYWVTRMTPLINDSKRRYFIAADRVGDERGTGYMGNSCIIQLESRPKLITKLDRYSEGILEFKKNNFN